MTVGVAVALYNGERFIVKQLDSIRLQTKQPFEVIFCDDGSKDNTVQIVRNYIDEFCLGDSWHIYENESNLGYIGNFYKAISLCNADLVFLSDQDDIWERDKIEKMTKTMESKEEICLLSCKYGIIDAYDNKQHSIVEGSAKETQNLYPVTVMDIMKAYRWPGMAMCIKKSFFDTILPSIKNVAVAHDFMFACLSADVSGFYEYDYVGVYHRRHETNAAREEHRVFKLLDRKRKLYEISTTETLLTTFLNSSVALCEDSKKTVENRLQLLRERKLALENKSLLKIVKLYLTDKSSSLRFKSFVCDVWLCLFG